jgi:tRNA(Ile)-lysidine synthase
MKSNLAERILKTIRNYDMVRPGDTILAAVSGGPDSIFLLHILVNLKRKLKLKGIIVANLDHGLRAKESRDDSRFVKEYSAKLGLKFMHKKVNLKSSKSNGLSTEERARLAGYKFFNEAAKASGANVIAMGHTLDDQAETVVMRLIKGASLKGMAGVSPTRYEGKFKVIRPLIELEKSEILSYLDNHKIGYRIDSSNAELVYFRNIVRHEIMPFLAKYNPKLKRVLFNLSEHLREDFEFISREKERVQKEIVRSNAHSVEISLKDIVVQPTAIQKEILRDSLEKCGGEVKKLSFRHWKEVESLLKYGRKGNSVDLPGSIRAHRTSSLLVFSRI